MAALALIISLAVLLLLRDSVAERMHRYRRQADLVARVQEAGGGVRWSDWWVVVVTFPDQFDVTPLIKEFPKTFPRLEVLGLSDTQVEDADLRHVGQCNGLRELYLNRTPISDAGLEDIRGLAELRVLHMGDTGITDEGLHYVGALSNLEELVLQNTAVTDAGVNHLRNLRQLKRLYFVSYSVKPDALGCRVTHRGLAKLKKNLPNLKVFPAQSMSMGSQLDQ